MKATIIITSHNYGRFLRQCINSALEQTYPDTEVIVVDDGSVDESPQIIRSYGSRIIPVLKENGGQASAFNAGFKLSNGDFICFVDSDDVLLPTAMEKEGRAAAKVLGYRRLEFWREPDGALRATAALMERLRNKINRLKPQMLYIPHAAEMHSDHRAAARLVRRVLRYVANPPEVRFYEVWTPLQQIDHVQDIAAQIRTKVAAMRAHKSQCAIMRFDDSALGLARYRGEMHSWPGGPYAEVFRSSAYSK